jgi:hypothetical protein
MWIIKSVTLKITVGLHHYVTENICHKLYNIYNLFSNKFVSLLIQYLWGIQWDLAMLSYKWILVKM